MCHLIISSLFRVHFLSFPLSPWTKMDGIGSDWFFSHHSLGCWTPASLTHCNITKVTNLLLFTSKSNTFKIFPNNFPRYFPIYSRLVGRYIEFFFFFLSWYFPAAFIEEQCNVFQQLKESCMVTSKVIFRHSYSLLSPYTNRTNAIINLM